jgi:DNA-binding transcriptional MerR regulator
MVGRPLDHIVGNRGGRVRPDLQAKSRVYPPSMGRYRVSEVAERRGLPPSTLRYYEDAGVLRPIKRTAAGYRIYDDRSVEGLQFVARAKQLGLSLDEITELAALWDVDQCQPVQHRMAQLGSRESSTGRCTDH